MYEFKLPDLGEGVHEGEILKWHVSEGGTIAEDAPLVDVETDKAAVTIPSPAAGTLKRLGGKVGDVVMVGNVIAVIDDGAASGAAVPAPAPARPAQAEAPTAPAPGPSWPCCCPAAATPSPPSWPSSRPVRPTCPSTPRTWAGPTRR